MLKKSKKIIKYNIYLNIFFNRELRLWISKVIEKQYKMYSTIHRFELFLKYYFRK